MRKSLTRTQSAPDAQPEAAIRALVQRWMDANLAGDYAALADMLDDDVVFLTPDRPPFGKAAFAEAPVVTPEITGSTEVLELHVFGDHAHLACFVDITIAPPGGDPKRHSGRTQTIVRRGKDGAWRIWRDANFVTPTA